jgi:hypothetical protein
MVSLLSRDLIMHSPTDLTREAERAVDIEEHKFV